MEFCFEQTIAIPQNAAFAFHEDPEHLMLLHRDWAQLRIIKHAGSVHCGNRTWFEMTVAKILPVVFGFEHFLYEPPQRFGERLIHGPFQKLVHIHEFEACGPITIVRDLLDIELPRHYGGASIMKTTVAPMIRQAFANRAVALQRLVAEGAIAAKAGQEDP